MEGAGPGHGWRRGRPIKIVAAVAVAVFLAAAGAGVLLLHARPGRILVHVLPVGQDMSSATAIAVERPRRLGRQRDGSLGRLGDGAGRQRRQAGADLVRPP